jgi:hypothetical protein
MTLRRGYARWLLLQLSSGAHCHPVYNTRFRLNPSLFRCPKAVVRVGCPLHCKPFLLPLANEAHR